MADGFNLPSHKRNKENASDGAFSGIREYAGGRALDSFLQKRAENIKKSRTNPPDFAPVEGSLQNSSGSNRSPLSTVHRNSPLAFVMGTTTKGVILCSNLLFRPVSKNVTPMYTWHSNGNHSHDINSHITSMGVGIVLASGHTVSKWTGGANSASNAVTPQAMEQEMLNLIVDCRDSKVTFDEFPYYLSEQTRVLLTSAAFVYLKNFEYAKHTRNLAPASRTILLSGPAEPYQQMLAKALAHYFGARLLLLDITDFSLKVALKSDSQRISSTHKLF
ncbi:hypothetical protein DCAR_0623742 [Daucus carota subsp. sativus]|nr:hypothetical protein DCAR_0623742 [Daucus carota subsp. sativus]